MPRMRSMLSSIALLLAVLCGAAPAGAQTASQALAGTRSIGDAIRASDRAAAATHGLTTGPAPIHILYVHGIGQTGAGDSTMLRKAICRYGGVCQVTSLGRLYAAGAFTVGTLPPSFTYLGTPVWTSAEDWSASAPFIDRYRISGPGHVPILLDELNWWPLVYPLKCRAMIAADAHLTGPDRAEIGVCAANAQPDPAHPGRFLAWPLIPPAQAAGLEALHRHASFLNRSLKNSVLDWGFSDAVMTLGPLEQVLKAAIRELLVQSLAADHIDPAAAESDQNQTQFFFITHSLGSYLTLASLDAHRLGDVGPSLPAFRPTAEQRAAADYFSAHTAGFYFLANQIEFLEMARLQTAAPAPTPCPAATGSAPATGSAEVPAATSIHDWQCRRLAWLRAHPERPNLITPQIIAWSDPDDLLTWNVPPIAQVKVVNLHVRNPGFKLPPLLVWPTGAHDNYAENRRVLKVIFKPTPAS